MVFAKSIMSKKLFGWTSSSKKSSKLVTDAVVLDENTGDSSERAQSSALSVSSLSPEMVYSQQFDNQSMSITRPNNLLIEPLSTPNSALSLNNTQQNVYQFSHINGLHIGTNVQINNNIEQSSDRQTNSAGGIQKTRSIDVMMRSTEPVDERVMDVISTHLGGNWQSLFRALDFSDGQIDQMKIDYHINGVKEVIYRLLLDYSRNNDDASLGHITRLMWRLGFKECVKILKIHWKKRDLVKTETNGNGESVSTGDSKSKSVE